MNKYMIQIKVKEEEGNEYTEEVFITLSCHAKKRMMERDIDEHTVYSSILALGERLLDLKCHQEFVIVDKTTREAVVGAVSIDNSEIIVDIITVINTNKVFVHEGQKVFNI